MLKQKIIGWDLSEFLEIPRCPEGAKIGFKQLIVEYGELSAVLSGRS